MSKRFPEYNGLKLPEINDSILEKWGNEDVFARTMSEREGCPSFVFFEGPPSANGKPGIHHVLARTIKDIFCRYKTMQGYQVKRKAGWDTHGLPVELGVEKNLGITKEDIGKKISVDDYNAACRREVMKYTGEWEDLTRRMGYWVDMPNAYITYDNRYIETVWWLLGQLYEKGYLYKGYTIQPYSPAAGTGLSSHELNQPGCYRDVKDTTCVAQFRVLDNENPSLAPYRELLFKWGTPYFLAWTTTPWTLPSNTALAVGPDITYNIVRTYNPYSGKPITVVAADALMGSLFNAKAKDLPLDSYSKGDKLIPYEVVAQVKGLDLVGIDYEQLLPWVNPGEGAFRVIPGDYVTTEDGTGIVHIAGTFGADDLRVSRQNGIPPLHLTDRDGNIRPMVDLTGRFYLLSDLDPKFVEEMVDVEAYKPWEGQYVKNAYDPEATEQTETLDVKICMELKATDKVFKIEKHTHNYPHCWRTDKPVLYYPLDSWFIKTTAVRERLMQLNEGIKWKPASTGSGRFGKWLENLQDWNLSRSRYWGTPLPIWRTEDAKEELCISSVEQLFNEIERAVEAGFMTENPYRKAGFEPGNFDKANYEKIDLHRPYVDDIVLVSPSGKPMRREKDLIDVWFDSGSMPYAQIHYPFENKEAFDNREVYPADFIAEGVDQTRGWFFTLHAIAGMVFDSISYKTVISNGLVLDKYGNKMSKRLGNAVDPFGQISQYGADPVRWYMISNSAPWDNLKYDEKGVLETSRKLFSTLYNTYSFFALYANVDNFDPTAPQVPVSERPEIDRWILSLLNTLIKEVTAALDDYEPTRAARAIGDFVGDNLSNWYVRLNRKRFWGGEMTTDKLAAYQTLYTCLETVSRLMAPFAPFYADRLYRDLTGSTESVHLDRFPESDPALIDPELEERQKLAQDITSMTLALRRKVNLKVRQPLQTIMVPVADDARRAALEAIQELVKSEINVKDLKIVGNDEGILVKSVKPDFKKLGPKFGKQMKAAAEIIKNLDAKSIATLERDGKLTFDLNGTPAEVELTDVEIISEDIPGWLVANEGNLTIALDVTVTPELRREGIARDIVNRIQNIRKSRDYDITDRIALTFAPGEATDDAIRDFAMSPTWASESGFQRDLENLHLSLVYQRLPGVA
ncbi:isoleucine--tRNA ligase [uncultured Duncaniella sp.]|uniref:isoleucine--tRNA ligase n=1 Tax=uncultured Duncaniella sp. TaxID=2768039 RepID=UPI002608629A|nr:isoleucine--tRNA ligase [uncultured Duncaniella sp.]